MATSLGTNAVIVMRVHCIILWQRLSHSLYEIFYSFIKLTGTYRCDTDTTFCGILAFENVPWFLRRTSCDYFLWRYLDNFSEKLSWLEFWDFTSLNLGCLLLHFRMLMPQRSKFKSVSMLLIFSSLMANHLSGNPSGRGENFCGLHLKRLMESLCLLPQWSHLIQKRLLNSWMNLLKVCYTEMKCFACQRKSYLDYVWTAKTYRIFHIYWDKQTWANSVDWDQMLQSVNCLLLIQQVLDTSTGSPMNMINF